MDDNKQFWERFSRHYAGFMRRSQATYQQICKAMRPFLKRDMDVLELACGTGQLSIDVYKRQKLPSVKIFLGKSFQDFRRKPMILNGSVIV